MRISKIVNQLAIAFSLFNSTQISPLDILDQCQLMRFLVTHLADDGRNDMQLRQLRRAPAPFAGNQLVAVACPLLGTDKNGLDKALGPNGIGKLGKPFLVKAAARLPGADIDPFNRNFTKAGQLRLRRLPGSGNGCLRGARPGGSGCPGGGGNASITQKR